MTLLFSLLAFALGLWLGKSVQRPLEKIFIRSYDDENFYLSDGTAIARAAITKIRYDKKELCPYLINKNTLVLPKED